MLAAATIRAVTPDDARAILEIAHENGHDHWEWTPDSYGTVACVDGRVVAFCTMRGVPGGLVVEDLWSRRTREGLHGLTMLADWSEGVARKLASERGTVVKLGGVVLGGNVVHKRALENRGYVVIGEVLAKEFHP